MKYTLVTQRGGCHHFMDALFRSLEKSNIKPDEILVTQNSEEPGPQLHFEALKARNDYLLLVDHDVMLFDNQLVEEMCHHMTQPNVFACGVLDYPYAGIPILFPSCTMVNRKMYLENGVSFSGSEPCVEPFSEAMRKGQKLVKIGKSELTYSLDKRVFHLNQGFKKLYSILLLDNFWRESFNKWKELTGSTASFDDYVHDDGLDLLDIQKLFSAYCDLIEHFMENKLPFSMLLLGKSGIEFVENPRQDNVSVAEELKQLIGEATFVDCMAMCRGSLEAMHDPELENQQLSLYRDAGFKTVYGSVVRGTYCFPIHNYMFLVENLGSKLYPLLKRRKVLYAGPNNAMGELVRKRAVDLSDYAYFQISEFQIRRKCKKSTFTEQ